MYHDRSPINHAANIRCPLLVLQGADDKVVPPEQAEMIVKAVQKNGGKVEYILFEGEGHGFRQAANIKRAVEAQCVVMTLIGGNELTRLRQPDVLSRNVQSHDSLTARGACDFRQILHCERID